MPVGRTAQYLWTQGGGVPGGHHVIVGRSGKPFLTPVRECQSIPLRHTDVVCDIGAYVGTYAIRCARFPVRKVIAYEPTALSYAILNLTRLPNLETHRAAVTGRSDTWTIDGEVTLYVSKGIGVTNSLVPSRSKIPVRVPALSYARAVAGATIVKIDIEGGEYAIPEIVAPHLRAIIIDFHKVGPYWIDRAEAIIARIEGAGFRPVIAPDWTCGWTCAGSWMRDLPDEGETCVPMMTGAACCGCGASIEPPVGERTLCTRCWPNWLPRHRTGYQRFYPDPATAG